MDGFLEEVPGLVDDDASPEAVTEPEETTPESEPEGQQAQDEVKEPEVKTYEIEIDGEKMNLTADELREWRETVTNMRAMRAASTQQYQEAKRLKEEADSKLNDPEFQRLKNIDAMLREHPETLDEFRRLAMYLENPNALSQQPAVSPINTQLAYKATVLESQLREVETAKRVAEVEAQVEAFRDKHPMSDDEFAQMYTALKAEVPKEVFASPNFGDVLEFYHFKNFGSVETQVKVAEAREAAALEAEKKIAEGKAVGGVKPSGHTALDWTPPKNSGVDPLESARRAAMDDPEIQFDGWIFPD